MKAVKASRRSASGMTLLGHGVVFPQLVKRGVVAEEGGVVGLDGLDGAQPVGGDGDDARVLVVGVGAQLGLQPRLQRGRLLGVEVVEGNAVAAARPRLGKPDGLAVEPVGGPVGRGVGAVAPDGAELLPADGAPDVLAPVDGGAVEDELAVGGLDGLGNGRRHLVDLGAEVEQRGEGDAHGGDQRDPQRPQPSTRARRADELRRRWPFRKSGGVLHDRLLQPDAFYLERLRISRVPCNPPMPLPGRSQVTGATGPE